MFLMHCPHSQAFVTIAQVLADTQQAAELKVLLDQENQRAKVIKNSLKELKNMRRRTDNLVYQLLPREVAMALRKGASAVSMCQVTESVHV